MKLCDPRLLDDFVVWDFSKKKDDKIDNKTSLLYEIMDRIVEWISRYISCYIEPILSRICGDDFCGG